MISKKIYKILKGFDELGKKGIFVKMDSNNFNKYKVFNLLNWSDIHEDSQYPFAENLKQENPDLMEYFTFETNSESVFLNEKALQDIEKYKREKGNENRANWSFIVSVFALLVSIIAIYITMIA